MNLFEGPIPFEEAIARHDVRQLLPTALKFRELQQLDAAILRGSFFSAQTTELSILDAYKEKIATILAPTQIQRPDRITPDNPQGNVTVGMDLATARMQIKDLWRGLGYQPAPDKRGTIEDLSSNARINLVIQTNRDLANGAGQYAQGLADQDILDAFPAWELFRATISKIPRDWHTRFADAAQDAGDEDAMRILEETGLMVALKTSGTWDSLGDGAGGFLDVLHNPFAPFAINSGMRNRNVSRGRWRTLAPWRGDVPQQAQEMDFSGLAGIGENALSALVSLGVAKGVKGALDAVL